MKNNTSGNIILVHKGALGDFLLAWPLFFSIRECFPDKTIYWHGRNAFLGWLEPLKILKAPPDLGDTLDLLYSRPLWPEILRDFNVFWFGLDRITVPCSHPNLVYLKGVTRKKRIHVRKAYAQKLESLDIPFRSGWQRHWNTWFGGDWQKKYGLIFPGSGSPLKNWPLENFVWAGRRMEEYGIKCRMVLGPAESNVDTLSSGLETVRCENLEQLQELMLQARLVLGNDSGPMHLGAMFGVPGLVLFGPTPLNRWLPRGMKAFKSRIACAPCSETGRIECSAPRCMSAVKKENVLAWIKRIRDPVHSK